MTSPSDDNLPGLQMPEEARGSGKRAANPPGAERVANLGEAWDGCEVPDFRDPERPKTCLEVDFPIAQINALSQLEGNAGKPIYQMSKWWARRRSSVFRAMLIAAATRCPDDPSEAAKTVWEHYYCNHQKAGKFKHLKVLEPFMGGGTTLVEGARLGMRMTGIDLNPVAWFVCKNELAGSDPEQVEALFAEIEEEVKPQIQVFYTTSCPRGHRGRFVEIQTGRIAGVDPVSLPPEERKRYRYEGPEIIYTFWAKHAPCGAYGCDHRTPLFKSLVIAQKTMTTNYLELFCPECGGIFHAELGESRMAPGAEFLVADADEPAFTTTTQEFANLLNRYDRHSPGEMLDIWRKLNSMVAEEPGLRCPHCGAFAGKAVQDVLRKHAAAQKASKCRKKDFQLRKKKVQLFLLVAPDWAKGAAGTDEHGNVYGGYAGAPPADTAAWNEKRLESLSLIEIRAKREPESFLFHGEMISTKGTVPRQAHFICSRCGQEHNVLDSVRPTGHTAPVACYALQCHCPQCEAEGYRYNGRYFKAPDADDIRILNSAEAEWAERNEQDLHDFWPREICWDAYMMRANGGVNDSWGYTHWWKMFNPRQLLVHTHLLRAIVQAEERWPLDVCEQALGAFQQYLRNQNMFSFWDMEYDKLVPMMSNANFHPKNNVIENGIFHRYGRGNFKSNQQTVTIGLAWAKDPWECFVTDNGSEHLTPGDPLTSGNVFCGSSEKLSMLEDSDYDLAITDPPFGDNLFYADLADFFYVWLRIPLRKWYAGKPEEKYFTPERTPHKSEAVENRVEHPDDREEYEKVLFIDAANLATIRRKEGNDALEIGDPNPRYRPEPAGEFYSRTLANCWMETGKHLKPGGIMAFTFHHSRNEAWIGVLQALFEAGFYLTATYPIRSDETKGENAAFGSQSIEYDVIHVCRKRLSEPEPVSYSEMRKFVREEAGRLKSLLETTHGRELPEADLRVILRGKSLEFYSQHYGKVVTGSGELLNVRDALLGINQMLDDVLEDSANSGALRPPESAEPVSRLYLRIFRNVRRTSRDALHKTLQGSGISQNDLESRKWIQVTGREVAVTSIPERYAALTRPGLTRKQIKTDLDQCFFLMGMILAGKKLNSELENSNLKLKSSVPDILQWFSQTAEDSELRDSAAMVLRLLEQFEQQKQAEKPEMEQLSLNLQEEI